jgi:glucose-6-phosphate isomerase
VALAIGMNGFERLLMGAEAMDTHFRTTPLEQNLPVLMALISIWNTNFLGAETTAILPYNESMRHFRHFYSNWKWSRMAKRLIVMVRR